MQVKTVQHGLGTRGPRSRATGDLVCGPETLTEAHNSPPTVAISALTFWLIRSMTSTARIARRTGPRSPCRYSPPRIGAARDCIRAAISKVLCAPPPRKSGWKRTASNTGRISIPITAASLQKRFFDYFLKGEKNGWDSEPRVLLQVRHVDRFEERVEKEWPLARTQWTKFYFDFASGGLVTAPPAERASLSFDAMGDGVTFMTPPLAAETEITGPSAVKLFLSSSTEDADVFAVLRVFSPDMTEIVFQGAIDPHTPIGQGWLRASHRKLDPALSKPWRPYHTHDERQPLKPGVPVELDVEIWPTSIVVPAGYRIALTIRGKDYEHACKRRKTFELQE